MAEVAVTKLDPVYPGYVNLKRVEDGTFVLTVRGDPKGGQCGVTAQLALSPQALGEWLIRADEIATR